MNEAAIKDLLYKIADDQLILGHRNSEWTGFGPLLEEDIAFSSMAQDKLGHSLAFYSLLHEMGESDPDTVAFMRNKEQFHNCQLVELPNGDYDFSLVRHFLYDNAEVLRFEMLSKSSFEPIAKIAMKLKGEVKYHVLHANTMFKQLATSTEEARTRMQEQLNAAMPFALGIFEKSNFEDELRSAGIFDGEEVLKQQWEARIAAIVAETNLELPDLKTLAPKFGGRYGEHTEHLQPLLDEMAEVFNLDPTAEW